MRAKYARLIRIGINAQRTPYIGTERDGRYMAILDFARVWEDATAYELNKHKPLVELAARRTKPFTTTREKKP